MIPKMMKRYGGLSRLGFGKITIEAVAAVMRLF